MQNGYLLSCTGKTIVYTQLTIDKMHLRKTATIKTDGFFSNFFLLLFVGLLNAAKWIARSKAWLSNGWYTTSALCNDTVSI